MCDLAQCYSVDISNRFQALSLTEEDVESQWAAISSAIKKSADVVVGRKKCARKPWLSVEAFDIVQRKLMARKQGDHQECNRLRMLFDKTAKNDSKQFYTRIADEAETGMVRNDLCTAYRVIRDLGGNTQAQLTGLPISDSLGVPCKSDEDTMRRWAEHFKGASNYPRSPPCQEHDDAANNSLPSASIPDNAPSLDEVQRAIQRLRYGRGLTIFHRSC